MAIRFRKVCRPADPRMPEVKKFYPVISYRLDIPADLREVAQELSVVSGVSEGACYSILKDFPVLVRKALLSGRSVNLEGLGFFYLSARSAGKEHAADLSFRDIEELHVCFRADNDIRLGTRGYRRSQGLSFINLDRKGLIMAENPLDEFPGAMPAEENEPFVQDNFNL